MKNTVKTQLELAALGLVILQIVQVAALQDLIVILEARPPVELALPVLHLKRYGKDLQLGKY